MPREKIVITGVGVVSSIGIGAKDFFSGLLDRRSGVRSLLERTDGDATPSESDLIDGVWVGAPVVDFEPKQFVRPRKALKVMSREIQLAFSSAQLAIESAGLAEFMPASPGGPIAPERLGAVYGSEMLFFPPGEMAESIRRSLDGNDGVSLQKFGETFKREVMPLWMLKYLPNMPGCQIGISVNSLGPNNSLVLGDVSGPAAVLEADSCLRRGVADAMIVGATGTKISAGRMIYRHDLALPKVDEGDVADTSRPYDPTSQGVVGGEGAASVVMENHECARERGAEICAELLAVASRFFPSDAIKSGRRCVPPEGTCDRGARKAIGLAVEAVLSSANVSAEDVGLVVSHAMGDPEIDSAELQALSDKGIDAPVVAIAASIGHTGAASGMLEIATGVLAVQSKTAPPTRSILGGKRLVAGESIGGVRLCEKAEPLQAPLVLCVAHTTEGSATATLLGPA